MMWGGTERKGRMKIIAIDDGVVSVELVDMAPDKYLKRPVDHYAIGDASRFEVGDIVGLSLHLVERPEKQ